MAGLSFIQVFIFIHHFTYFFLIIIPNSSRGHVTEPKKGIVPLFIFGDSIFDAGNNNYINTTTIVQANFWPYGENFFRYPTGRHSDGRLIPDFIAEYAKLPFIAPYLQPGYHQYTNGVNFASGGAGALAQTNQGWVIDLSTQLIHLKKMEKLLEQQLGENETKKLLSRAVYLFSIGGNDISAPFSPNSIVFQLYSPEKYVETVVGNVTTVIKEIYKIGGRKFGFVSLGALGCLPVIREFNLKHPGECMEEITNLVKLHNSAFSKVLERLERQLQGFKYSNFNAYAFAMEMIDSPSKYGFKESKSACCGLGPYRGLNSCGGRRGVEEYELCDNANEYLFFDYAHGTERSNEQLARLMWNGTPDTVWPYNLKALFEQK